MKLLIETAYGGFVIRNISKPEGEDQIPAVATDVVDMLNQVLDTFGELGSRYDKERIYIVRAPGDKNPNFTEAHAEVLYGTK